MEAAYQSWEDTTDESDVEIESERYQNSGKKNLGELGGGQGAVAMCPHNDGMKRTLCFCAATGVSARTGTTVADDRVGSRRLRGK